MLKPAVLKGSIVFVATFAMVIAFQNCGSQIQLEDQHRGNYTKSDQIVIDDMVLDTESIYNKGGDGDSSQAASGFAVFYARKWPGGIVPVVFDSTITSTQRTAFFTACSAWSVNSSVKCVNRSTQADYLYVTDDAPGCHTQVGAWNGHPAESGKRVFNFREAWCWDQPYLIHDVGHVLGLIHENQRPDRDSYIRIITENIIPEMAVFFEKFETVEEKSAYDYLSVMHYHSWSWTINPNSSDYPTILKLNGELIQHNKVLSSGDKAVIARMYPVIASSPTPTPQPSATPQPSPTPTPTATPAPTATPKRKTRGR